MCFPFWENVYLLKQKRLLVSMLIFLDMEKRRNGIIREFYSRAIIGAVLSGLLILASLYQLEIILIWISRGKQVFEFPLFLWSTSVWIARDIWYGVLILGWILGLWSGFKLGEVREFETLLESPEDATVLRELVQSHKNGVEYQRPGNIET